jgi:hypothetical protein
VPHWAYVVTAPVVIHGDARGLDLGTRLSQDAGRRLVRPRRPTLAGAWFDNATAAPTNATLAQIAADAVRGAEHFGNTTQAPNLNAEYVVASATGTHPDGFPNSGFCGWHSSTTSADGKLAYTNLPYVPVLGTGACTTIGSPTLLDGYFSTETHDPPLGLDSVGGQVYIRTHGRDFGGDADGPFGCRS